ncbi:hypothetical protein SLEP1_g52529 [Rubroshorea leprosula]|uniref:Uncharacterized protein n=1 Tax=Rubroshorea leprosula TaxID=152421 RepID=A0AAV5M988_9ROSI|nr:hypothetical protein SLEP1_g52529 [Rubroshorea leprosula]
MEIASLEIRNFKEESSCKQITNNLLSRIDATTGKERELCLYDSGASSSKEKVKKYLVKHSRSSKGCSSNSRNGKVYLPENEVNRLVERLKVLEEETEIIKEAFFETMEERRRLMSEVYQQFQTLRLCLHHKNAVGRKKAGLSQVLMENYSPRVLTRVCRINFNHLLPLSA